MLSKLIALIDDKKRFANVGELLESCKHDVAFRSLIESLSIKYLNRTVNGCSNCYMDAYFELININVDKLMSESKFKLKAGVLLRDVVNFDSSKNMTIHNTTDELAIYHLKTNPTCKDLFAVIPVDWELESTEPKTKRAKTEKEQPS